MPVLDAGAEPLRIVSSALSRLGYRQTLNICIARIRRSGAAIAFSYQQL
jgi:hypothetical protein